MIETGTVLLSSEFYLVSEEDLWNSYQGRNQDIQMCDQMHGGWNVFSFQWQEYEVS